MDRVVITVAVFVVAGVIALVLRRRQPAPPTQSQLWPVPTQLDRADFVRPDAPYLVAVFTSSTCASCARVREKARVLESADVAYQEIPYQDNKELHGRYNIEAVPMVLITGADGVVAKSFVGEVTAIDLWGGVATVRDPASQPPAQHQPPEHHDHSPSDHS